LRGVTVAQNRGKKSSLRVAVLVKRRGMERTWRKAASQKSVKKGRSESGKTAI